jgi:hypothetical protein
MHVAVHRCFLDDGTPTKRGQGTPGRDAVVAQGALTLDYEFHEPFGRWTKVARLMDGAVDVIPPMIKAEVFFLKDGLMKVEGTYYDDLKGKYHAQSWRCRIPRRVAIHQCFFADGTPVKRWQEAFRRESNYPEGQLSLDYEFFAPFGRSTPVARLMNGTVDVIPFMVRAEVFFIKNGMLKLEGTYYNELTCRYHTQSWRCKVVAP